MRARLVIYNILGQRVSTLVDKVEPTGEYTVSFNGSGLASGVYIVVLELKNGLLTKKMTLIK